MTQRRGRAVHVVMTIRLANMLARRMILHVVVGDKEQLWALEGRYRVGHCRMRSEAIDWADGYARSTRSQTSRRGVGHVGVI